MLLSKFLTKAFAFNFFLYLSHLYEMMRLMKYSRLLRVILDKGKRFVNLSRVFPSLTQLPLKATYTDSYPYYSYV